MNVTIGARGTRCALSFGGAFRSPSVNAADSPLRAARPSSKTRSNTILLAISKDTDWLIVAKILSLIRRWIRSLGLRASFSAKSFTMIGIWTSIFFAFLGSEVVPEDAVSTEATGTCGFLDSWAGNVLGLTVKAIKDLFLMTGDDGVNAGACGFLNVTEAAALVRCKRSSFLAFSIEEASCPLSIFGEMGGAGFVAARATAEDFPDVALSAGFLTVPLISLASSGVKELR